MDKKEQLKQEAEELIQRFEIANSMNNFLQLTPDRKQIGEMLVMFAEPREKQIAELKSQIEKMKCGGNCKHEYWINTGGCYDQKCKFTGLDCTNCKDKWELKRD